MTNKVWRIWAKALGERVSDCDKESDQAAWIRTILILQAFITNFVIISGVIRHWNG